MRPFRAWATACAAAVLVTACSSNPAAVPTERPPELGNAGSSPTEPDPSDGPVQVAAEALPGVSQPGSNVASPEAAGGIVVVDVTPASPGAQVQLLTRGDGRWVEADQGVLDAEGDAVLQASDAGAYRVEVMAADDSVAGTADVAASDWDLSFSDGFDGTSLDPEFWDYRQLGVISAKSSRGKAVSSVDAVKVGDGAVRLQVLPYPERDGFYLNGHISTEGRYQFTYGLAAARVKFQRPRGMHGAFWIQSPTFSSDPGNPDEAGTEIDVAEFFGEGYPDGGLVHMVHFLTSDGESDQRGDVFPSASRALAQGQSWWDSYHVFSVEWTPEAYVFRVDGLEVYRTTDAISGAQQFLVLSLLTSDWELPALDPSTLPGSMYVDWVRVWQQ